MGDLWGKAYRAIFKENEIITAKVINPGPGYTSQLPDKMRRKFYYDEKEEVVWKIENGAYQQETNLEDSILKGLNIWKNTLPMELWPLLWENLILTGGAIASLKLGEIPNDWDIYFRDGDKITELLNHYLLPHGIKAFFEYHKIVYKKKFECYDYYSEELELPYRMSEVYLTENSLNLQIGPQHIQLITKHFGTPQEIIETFDFVHCTAYFTFEKGLVISTEAETSIITRILIYKGNEFTQGSLYRIKKFLRRGWDIRNEDLDKLHENIERIAVEGIEIHSLQ